MEIVIGSLRISVHRLTPPGKAWEEVAGEIRRRLELKRELGREQLRREQCLLWERVRLR